MKISVVVCVRNEESRIKECLELVVLNNPDEIILVDGSSTDKTVEIAKKFQNIKIIETKNSNLTRDRQIGINAAVNDLIAMVDADHRLEEDDLKSLVRDMRKYDLDIVQSGLVSFKNHGFWDSAEEETWKLTHNVPGTKKMIGTAPAIYKKKIFELVQFNDEITSTIDDTDFIYRLSKFPEVKIGIGETNIKQFHFADFKTYYKKFQWYGKGDGEFCKKNKERMPSMLFHLCIRYPFVYPIRALVKGYYRASLFYVFQGTVRFYGLCKYFLKLI